MHLSITVDVYFSGNKFIDPVYFISVNMYMYKLVCECDYDFL